MRTSPKMQLLLSCSEAYFWQNKNSVLFLIECLGPNSKQHSIITDWRREILEDKRNIQVSDFILYWPDLQYKTLILIKNY